MATYSLKQQVVVTMNFISAIKQAEGLIDLHAIIEINFKNHTWHCYTDILNTAVSKTTWGVFLA